ncbi:MAG: Crp/Fnr family transcriptional regulator [Bacteroidota bacterium]
MYRLNDFSLFKYLSDKEKTELQTKSMMAEFKKGETIIKKGTLNSQIGLLVEGFARLYAEDGSFKRIIDIIKPNWLIAILSLFNEKSYNVSVSAVTDCKIIFIPKTLIEKLIRNNGIFAEKFTETQAMIANRYIQFLAFQNQKNVRGRIAEVLIYLSEYIYNSPEFHQTISRREMAYFANTTIETVIRILSEFKKDGLIDITNKRISIKNIQLLKRLQSIG